MSQETGKGKYAGKEIHVDFIPEQSPDGTATAKSWKTQPAPEEREAIHLEASFSESDFSKIARGFIPSAMEDKWFIYYADGWLNMHRSWTGAHIYGLQFVQTGDEFHVVDSWANRDKYCRQKDIDFDRKTVLFIIDVLLLNKRCPAPVEKSADSHTAALRAWSNFGKAAVDEEDS